MEKHKKPDTQRSNNKQLTNEKSLLGDGALDTDI